MIRVGVVGASGYMGGEVLRVLMEHPAVDIAWATSRSAGRIGLAIQTVSVGEFGGGQ